MKRTLIALAVAGAAVATGVNAGELYNQDGTTLTLGGRAEARMSIKDGDVLDKSRVRINVSGKQEISDDLYGVGFYEAEYTTSDRDEDGNENDDSSSIEHRYAYAGLGGNFGEITYGKNDAALGVITDFTDIMDYHGAKASDKLNSADRIDNLLAYKGDFNDLSVKAAYRFADRDESYDSIDDNDADAFSLSGIYTVADTGLAIGLGYADEDDKANQWMLTASYTWNDLYVSALYSAADLDNTDNDYDGFELAASYKMEKTVFYVTYNNGQVDDGHISSTVSDEFADSDNLAFEVAYFFKPNFRGYVSYDFNMLDDDEVGNAAAEDEAVLGLRYDF